QGRAAPAEQSPFDGDKLRGARHPYATITILSGVADQPDTHYGRQPFHSPRDGGAESQCSTCRRGSDLPTIIGPSAHRISEPSRPAIKISNGQKGTAGLFWAARKTVPVS